MGTSVGTIFLDLVVKNTVKKQVGDMAAAAQQQAQRSFEAVGKAAGEAVQRTMGTSYNKTLEKAKARVKGLEKQFEDAANKMDAMRESSKGMFSGLQNPGKAAQQYLEGNKAYQTLAAQQEAMTAKLEQAQENLRIETENNAAKMAAAQERAQERSAAAAERAAQRQEAAAQKAAAAQKREQERAAAAAARAQEKAARESERQWKKSTQGMRRLFRTIGRTLKATFLTAGLYAFFRTMKSLMGGALNDNKQFSRSLAQVKANLSTAFQPILQAIMPALTALANGLASVTRSIASFIAGLFGTVYTKASAAAKKLQGVTAGAKKAAGQLAAFDEINVLQKNDEAGDDAGGGMDFGQQADQEAQSLGERFRAALARWLEPLREISFDNVIAAFKRLSEAGQALGKTAFAGLEWAYFNLLVPLSKWNIEEFLPAFFDTLAAAADLLNAALIAFAPAAQALWDNFLEPIAQWTGGFILDVLAQLQISFGSLTAWIQENSGRIKVCFDKVGEALNYVWLYVIHPVLTFAKTFLLGWISTLTQRLQGMADAIITVLGGIADFLIGVFTGDWERAFKGLGNVAIGIANNVISGFEMMVNRAIDAVNGLISAASKLPVIGEKIGSFSIAPFTLPRIPELANGGVIKQPTLAMMGEYAGAGNNPEIVAPEDKLRGIFSEGIAPLVEAIRELVEYLMEGGSQEITIRFAASGGLEQLVRLLEPYIAREGSRRGVKLIQGGVY